MNQKLIKDEKLTIKTGPDSDEALVVEQDELLEALESEKERVYISSIFKYYRAQNIIPPDDLLFMNLEELEAEYESKVIPDATRGSGMLRASSAGGESRGKEYQPRYLRAQKFIVKYHQDNPGITYVQARRKAAKKVGLSDPALKKHFRKARDFPDW